MMECMGNAQATNLALQKATHASMPPMPGQLLATADKVVDGNKDRGSQNTRYMAWCTAQLSSILI